MFVRSFDAPSVLLGCSATDCSGEVEAKGFCSKHYQRFVKYGTTFLPRRYDFSAVSDTDLAYAAGTLEADGCFIIKKKGSTSRPLVSLAMVQPEVPYWLSELFGGGVQYSNPPARQYVRRQYCWEVGGGRAGELCRALLPWMKFKIPQANLILEYLEGTGTFQTRAGSFLPEAEVARREAIRLRVKALNRPGR